jgi:hypothetical protein
MLVSGSLVNLVGGVSQQPAPLRLSSMCSRMENAWPSLMSGLQKRPPTEHVSMVNIPVPNKARAHFIERSNTYRYLVIAMNGDLKVVDVDTGAEQTVTFPDGKAYLNVSSPNDDYRFQTIGDYTFVLNRTKVVETVPKLEVAGYTPDGTAANLAALPTAAVGYLDQVYQTTDTSFYYLCVEIPAIDQVLEWELVGTTTVIDGDTWFWNFPSPTGYTISDVIIKAEEDGDGGARYFEYILVETQAAVGVSYAWQNRDISQISPNFSGRRNPQNEAIVYVQQSVANHYYSVYIDGVLEATYLTPVGVDATTAVPDTGVIATELATALTTSGWTVVQNGSTLTITDFPTDSKIQVQGGSGDKALKAFYRSVLSFSDLPPNAPEGKIVNVQGDPAEQGDDYYVIFNDGLWEECVGYNAGEELKLATMPHSLIRNADGTWTFEQHDWRGRTAGDADSSQNPSFVGRNINDLFTWVGRFGLLSDENIILSEANNYENFYRTTVTQLVDSDPIDVAALSNQVNIMRHATQFNKDLIVTSSKEQFRIAYDTYLSPKTIKVQFSSGFDVSERIKPTVLGTSLYMVDDRPFYNYVKINEFYPRENGTIDDADDVTAPTPEYIKNNVQFATGSDRNQIYVVGTEGEPDSLFVYKYFWAGDKKVQNAWSKWSFPSVTRILWAGFSGSYMYMLFQRPDGLFFEKMFLDEDVYTSASDLSMLIDRRYQLDPADISFAAGDTTVTLPYEPVGTVEVMSSDASIDVYSVRHTATATGNPDEYTVANDDLTGEDVVVGIPYNFIFEFSTIYPKQQRGQGEVALLDGRVQLKYLTISYSNTAYFGVSLEISNRPTYTFSFTGRITGLESSNIGEIPLDTGSYRLPVLATNRDATITLNNNTPYPCSFGNAEYQAEYQPKARKRI